MPNPRQKLLTREEVAGSRSAIPSFLWQYQLYAVAAFPNTWRTVMSHTHALNDYQHSHVFLGEQHHRNERRTWLVVTLTAAMMVVEIAAGMLFGSMALLADGIHMATHAGALTVSGIAYSLRASARQR